MILLAIDDQQGAAIGVLRVYLRLRPRVEVRVAHLHESDPGAGDIERVVGSFASFSSSAFAQPYLNWSNVSVIARPRVCGSTRNGPMPLSTNPGRRTNWRATLVRPQASESSETVVLT